jgi:hypothetical protein
MLTIGAPSSGGGRRGGSSQWPRVLIVLAAASGGRRHSCAQLPPPLCEPGSEPARDGRSCRACAELDNASAHFVSPGGGAPSTYYWDPPVDDTRCIPCDTRFFVANSDRSACTDRHVARCTQRADGYECSCKSSSGMGDLWRGWVATFNSSSNVTSQRNFTSATDASAVNAPGITAGRLTFYNQCDQSNTSSCPGQYNPSRQLWLDCHGVACRSAPAMRWHLIDSSLVDGELVPARRMPIFGAGGSQTQQTAAGDDVFSWPRLLQDILKAGVAANPRPSWYRDVESLGLVSDSFPTLTKPNSQARRVAYGLRTGFESVNGVNGVCQDINECATTHLCSNLYPNGLYPSAPVLEKLTQSALKQLKGYLDTHCTGNGNSSADKFCGKTGEDDKSMQDKLNSLEVDLSSLFSGGLDFVNGIVNGDNKLVKAPYCVNTIGSFACCMDYRDADNNKLLRDGQGLPFMQEQEHWYPPVCKAVDWCNKVVSTDVSKSDTSNLWLNRNGGCSSLVECKPLPLPLIEPQAPQDNRSV